MVTPSKERHAIPEELVKKYTSLETDLEKVEKDIGKRNTIPKLWKNELFGKFEKTIQAEESNPLISKDIISLKTHLHEIIEVDSDPINMHFDKFTGRYEEIQDHLKNAIVDVKNAIHHLKEKIEDKKGLADVGKEISRNTGDIELNEQIPLKNKGKPPSNYGTV